MKTRKQITMTVVVSCPRWMTALRTSLATVVTSQP